MYKIIQSGMNHHNGINLMCWTFITKGVDSSLFLIMDNQVILMSPAVFLQ